MHAIRAGGAARVVALSFFLLTPLAFAQVAAFPALGDHLKCYKVKDPLKLTGTVDLLAPQFGLEPGCRIGPPKLFCVPVKKRVVQVTPSTPMVVTGQPLVDDHVCYPIRCPKPVPPLANRDIVDQFGRRTISNFTAFLLCTPTKKEPVEHDVFPNSSATVVVPPQPLCPTGDTVQLSGPTGVDVFVGMLADTDGNGLEQVPTEMVQLSLMGTTTCPGPPTPVTVMLRSPTLHPFRHTVGEIEETTNTQTGRLDVPPFAPSGTATSFFDVFFELDVGPPASPLIRAHNHTPKHMQGTITHKPPDPGNTYDNPEVIQLYDDNEQPILQIGSSRHVPNPTTTTTTSPTTTTTLFPLCPPTARLLDKCGTPGVSPGCHCLILCQDTCPGTQLACMQDAGGLQSGCVADAQCGFPGGLCANVESCGSCGNPAATLCKLPCP